MKTVFWLLAQDKGTIPMSVDMAVWLKYLLSRKGTADQTILLEGYQGVKNDSVQSRNEFPRATMVSFIFQKKMTS